MVHGIGQQYLGPETLMARWGPALRDGVVLAGRELTNETISMSFYGDLFRSPGGRSWSIPDYDFSDIDTELEQELLVSLWLEASRVDKNVAGPGGKSRARTPQWAQRALYALSSSTFFSGLSERVLIGNLKQVSKYFLDASMREAIRARVSESIGAETRLVIGHSLGSVVAYEVLCQLVDRSAIAFVTLGSPLGIGGIVFDRLEPRPSEGLGHWPRSVNMWTNVADKGDVVALAKTLAPMFEGNVLDILVENGAHAHDIRPYLTAKETGLEISRLLAL